MTTAWNIVIDPLGVILVVGVGRGDTREQVLVGFAGQQVAVLERLLAEFGEERVAVRVGFHVERAGVDCLAGALGLGDRDIVRTDIARGRKIHLFSPCYWPFCDGLFCFCSTRCRASLAYSKRRGAFCGSCPRYPQGTAGPLRKIVIFRPNHNKLSMPPSVRTRYCGQRGLDARSKLTKGENLQARSGTLWPPRHEHMSTACPPVWKQAACAPFGSSFRDLKRIVFPVSTFRIVH